MVRQSLFALGAERSAGTSALVDALADAEPGVVVRRADAEVIPPLSDHWAFWQRQVPFLFLTCGRWQHYHQPSDELTSAWNTDGWVEDARLLFWLGVRIANAPAMPQVIALTPALGLAPARK